MTPQPERELAERVGRLAHALESDVIPRLVRQHRDPAAAEGPIPTAADRHDFVAALVSDDDERLLSLVDALRLRGVAVSALFIELLAPAARDLGALWQHDRIDFASTTLGLGRLQRLMRELCPDFDREGELAGQGRRVLLAQPPGEQHQFGLAMVAEFFRREGWEVVGGVGAPGLDPVAWARREWLDIVGLSAGSETALAWLRDTIAAVRLASRNPSVVVMVGGPIFSLHPDWARQVGADATADGRQAPRLADSLVEGLRPAAAGTAPVR